MKILTVSTSGLEQKEGISTVILDYFSRFDKERFDLSMVAQGAYSQELAAAFEAAGIRIVPLPPRKEKTLAYILHLMALMGREHYDMLYVHGSSAIMSIELGVAWLMGCKARVVHCHSTFCTHNRADRLLRPVFYKLYTQALACGEAAGQWLFPGRQFRIVKNGRDVQEYGFNPEIRQAMRQQLGLGEDTLALGHVGAFEPWKNQGFALEVFREVRKLRPDARLYLMGNGSMWNAVQEQAAQMGLREHVVFTGSIDNVPQMLQAMDAMLLPSLHEGLPLVAVEWQIAALPCLVSDQVSGECAYSDLVQFLPLENPAVWAQKLVEIAGADRNAAAEKMPELTGENGFDISRNVMELQSFFEQQCRK